MVPLLQKNKELLETRFFKNLKDLDYSECLTILGLWSLEKRRNRADLIEVFKIVNSAFLQRYSSSLKWTLEQGVTQECYLSGTQLETFDFTSSLKE